LHACGGFIVITRQLGYYLRRARGRKDVGNKLTNMVRFFHVGLCLPSKSLAKCQTKISIRATVTHIWFRCPSKNIEQQTKFNK